MFDDSTTQAVIIAGVKILQDASGRYSLNTLHQASHAPATKQPGQWLKRKSTQELINELDSQVSYSTLGVVHGGEQAGTYAHELLAVSYAGWISPAFQLRVNQAFLDAVRSSAKPVVKNPSNQLLIDAVVRIDMLEQAQESQRDALIAQQAEIIATQQKALEGFLLAEKASIKADVALEDAHRMTVEEYVIKNGLLRQYPPGEWARMAAWLGNFCQQWGIEVHKAPVLGKNWDSENAYPLQAFAAFSRYDKKRPRQIALVKDTSRKQNDE